MKYIKGSKWSVIEEISLKYKMLEDPINITKKIYQIKLSLLNEYGLDWWGELDDLKLGDDIRIIYSENDTLEDYNLLITKITEGYLYGTGGLLKFKKENIMGVII